MFIVVLQGFSNKRKKNSVPASDTTQNSSAILPISVKQKYHEHEQFNAILTEACNHFSQIYIPIGDYNYRHTLQMWGLTEEEATKQAEVIGDKWESDHKQIIEKVKSQGKAIVITHWKEELKNPDFVNSKKYIEDLYTSNNDFKYYVNLAASSFSTNYAKENENTEGFKEKFVGPDKAYALCLNYIKEELAVFLLWRRKYNTCNFFYPFEYNLVSKNIRKAVEYMFQSENKLNFLNIDILQPQKKEQEQISPKSDQDLNINASSPIPISSKVTKMNNMNMMFKSSSKPISRSPSPTLSSSSMTNSPEGSPSTTPINQEQFFAIALNCLMDRAANTNKDPTDNEIKIAAKFAAEYTRYVTTQAVSIDTDTDNVINWGPQNFVK